MEIQTIPPFDIVGDVLFFQLQISFFQISKPYNHLENLMTQWIAATNAEPPELPHSAKQRIWDRPLLERVTDEMADTLPSASDQARWRAVTAPHAGDWLVAMPIASCGLKLDDEAVKVAVDLGLTARDQPL